MYHNIILSPVPLLAYMYRSIFDRLKYANNHLEE